MPVPGHATPEGTAAYRARFNSRVAEGYFRQHQQLWLSSIGVGTYLGEPDEATDRAYTDAVVRALELGSNVLDSAINYRFQRSERSIAAALRRLIGSGAPKREEVVICTKAGFLTPDGEMPPDPRRYFDEEYVSRGVLPVKEVAGGVHCMAPAYLADQIERSLRNLDLETIDVFYLHNPEMQGPEVGSAEFLRRLRAAFELLEKKTAEGKIRFYGTATWNGYRVPPTTPEHLSLEKIVGLARELAGDGHHFRFVQLPYNLAMPEAFLVRTQWLGGRQATVLEAAEELGVTIVASASLLQARLANRLPAEIGQALAGLETDAQRAIQFVRSTPGIATALVGMSRAAHVEENLRVAAVPPAPEEQLRNLFR